MTEAFFTRYENTAWAFFTSFAFLLTMARLAIIMRKNSEKNAEKIIAKALLDQRQKYQSGLFDVQEKRHDTVCNAMIKFAEDAANCRKVLEENDIRIFRKNVSGKDLEAAVSRILQRRGITVYQNNDDDKGSEK